MVFEILVSCMNQSDSSIVSESNIHSKALVINQTSDDVSFTDSNTRFYSFNEKGLSKSRNRAINLAEGDICLLSDDDELFDDNVETIILEKYSELDADIIIFDLANYHKKIKRTIHKMKLFELLRVSSVQISFRLASIKGVVFFDENLGAGSPNGFGEETKFLMDAYKKKLKIYYVPIDIGKLKESESSWFSGYNYDYFYRRGKINRYVLGFFNGLIYSFYFLFFKYGIYRKTISFIKAFSATIKGFFSDVIHPTKA